jgi:hypothetical protein
MSDEWRGRSHPFAKEMSRALSDEPVDLIVTNARFATFDPGQPAPEAIAIAAGRFASVGDFEVVLSEAGPGTKILDVGGRRVVPIRVDMCRALFRQESTWSGAPHPGLTPSLSHAVGDPAADPFVAWSIRENDGKAAFRHGQVADLAVLSDGVTVPPGAGAESTVDLTLIAGVVAQGAGPFRELSTAPARR